MSDQLTIKKRARNLALDELHELSVRNTEHPYDIFDARGSVLLRLKRALSESEGDEEDALDALLAPIVDLAIRDADQTMCQAKADRLRQVQIGQLPIFMDYDPDATITLGERERIAWRSARVDHVKRSLRLDTDNVIAVNSAFAEKREFKQGLIDVMEPLDPRTTVADVVQEAA